MSDHPISFFGLRISVPGASVSTEHGQPEDPTSDGARCVERPLGGTGSLAHLGPSISLGRVRGPKEALSPEQLARRRAIDQRLVRFEVLAAVAFHPEKERDWAEARRLIASGEAATLEEGLRRADLLEDPVVPTYFGQIADPRLTDESFAAIALDWGRVLTYQGFTNQPFFTQPRDMRCFQRAERIYEILGRDSRFASRAQDGRRQLPQDADFDTWGNFTGMENFLLLAGEAAPALYLGAFVEKKVAQWLLPRVASQIGRRVLGVGARAATESLALPALQAPVQSLPQVLQERSPRPIWENYKEGVKNTAGQLGLIHGLGLVTGVAGRRLAGVSSFRLPNTAPSQGIAALRPSVRIPLQAAHYAATVEGLRRMNATESNQDPSWAQYARTLWGFEKFRLQGGLTNAASGGRMARMQQATERIYLETSTTESRPSWETHRALAALGAGLGVFVSPELAHAGKIGAGDLIAGRFAAHPILTAIGFGSLTLSGLLCYYGTRAPRIEGAARGTRVPPARTEGLLPASRPRAWSHFLSVFTNMGACTRREIGEGRPGHINMNESLETEGNRQALNIAVAEAADQVRVMEMAEQQARHLGLQFLRMSPLSPASRPDVLNFRVTTPEGGRILVGSISVGRVQGVSNSLGGHSGNVPPASPAEGVADISPITRRIRIQPTLHQETGSPGPASVEGNIEPRLQDSVRRSRGTPDEAQAWQVYADHLLETGDARGELILLEDRIAAAPESERSPLIERQGMLQRNLERDFREKIELPNGPQSNTHLSWRRGHIDAVEVTVGRNASLDGLKRVLVAEEARFLRRVQIGMVDSRELNSRNVVLSRNFFGTDSARELGNIPQLAGITELDLSCSNLRGQALEALLESPHLHRVTDLNLLADPIGEEGARALRETSNLPSLKRLDLRGSMLSESAQQALRNWARERGITLEL